MRTIIHHPSSNSIVRLNARHHDESTNCARPSHLGCDGDTYVTSINQSPHVAPAPHIAPDVVIATAPGSKIRKNRVYTPASRLIQKRALTFNIRHQRSIYNPHLGLSSTNTRAWGAPRGLPVDARHSRLPDPSARRRQPSPSPLTALTTHKGGEGTAFHHTRHTVTWDTRLMHTGSTYNTNQISLRRRAKRQECGFHL